MAAEHSIPPLKPLDQYPEDFPFNAISLLWQALLAFVYPSYPASSATGVVEGGTNSGEKRAIFFRYLLPSK
jgi:hypothetical protein